MRNKLKNNEKLSFCTHSTYHSAQNRKKKLLNVDTLQVDK